jgi:hypothetical protein
MAAQGQTPTVQEMEQRQETPAITAFQRLMQHRQLLVSLCQHPGWQAFQQYLMELDEAYDIMCLNAPKLNNVDNAKNALLERRLQIREFLHMFRNIKDSQAVA